MYTNITVGADPEVFLLGPDGNPMPAIGLLGGDKKNPNQITEHHSVQEDNVMAEFNIPPVTTAATFVRENNYCLKAIKDITGLSPLIKPSVEFDPSDLQSEKAKEFGCSADNNAWADGAQNPVIDPPETWRFAGGHIHVGYDNHNFDNRIALIKAMDLFLGMPAMLLDKDIPRRNTYGTPGRFRTTSFGVEYRTLSNFWLQSEAHMTWAFNSLMDAINYLNEGNEAPEIIQSVMLTGDLEEVKAFLRDQKITRHEFVRTSVSSGELVDV